MYFHALSTEWHKSEDSTRTGPNQCGKASCCAERPRNVVSHCGQLLGKTPLAHPSSMHRPIVTLGFRRTLSRTDQCEKASHCCYPRISADTSQHPHMWEQLSQWSPGFIRKADILSIALSLLDTMPPNTEASGASKQLPSASSLVVDQSLPPTLPPVCEAADRDSKRNVDTDKPYSVFSSRDRWLVVSFASFAALLRQVGTLYMF